MKVWEAIEMLQGMDSNKEVTVTMGKPSKLAKDEGFHLPAYPMPGYYTNPEWVIEKGLWPSRPVITCKTTAYDPKQGIH